MSGRRVILLLVAAATCVLAGGIVWAGMESPLSAGMRHLLSDRWGIVTLIDVYCGVLAIAVWIKLQVRSWLIWSAWTVGLICLGHLVTMVYLLQRLLRTDSLLAAVAPPATRDSGVSARSRAAL